MNDEIKIGVLIMASVLTVGGLFILDRHPEKNNAPGLVQESAGILPERKFSTEAKVSSSILTPPQSTAFNAKDKQTMASVGTDTRAEVTQAQVHHISKTQADRGSVQLELLYDQLNNKQPEIREEALNEIIQFEGREAIPRLKQIANTTENANEKARILEAIEFLELPTFSEQRDVRASNQQRNVAISSVHPRKSKAFFK